MILPYFARLLVLGLASFFLIHTALSLVLIAMRHQVVRLASSWGPRPATRFLLGIRLLPTVLAGLAVAGLCVPSYLWLEPDAQPEGVGLWCLSAAILGGVAWVIAIFRSINAVARSVRQSHELKRIGDREILAHWNAVVIEGCGPVFALAGVFRPRLFVSREILAALSDEQLSSAVQHELAHRASHDNLKRLLMLLVPDVLPFVHGGRSLDRAWGKFTEWAADDEAVLGSPGRSVSLATALVQVARLGVAPQPLPLATSLLGPDQDLSERVERLLDAKTSPAQSGHRGVPAAVGIFTVAITAASLLSLQSQQAMLSSVHELLEKLLR